MKAVDRGAALVEASLVLTELGFAQSDTGHWGGVVGAGAWPDMRLRVTLPESFPEELPIVTVDRDSLPRAIPHIERDGKVCIAPSSGVLVDSTHPGAIVRDAIERARRIVSRGSQGEDDEDLKGEFNAYWGAQADLLSFCASVRVPSVVAIAELVDPRNGLSFLAAENEAELARLASLLDFRTRGSERAYLVPLSSLPTLPSFRPSLSFRQVEQLLARHATADARAMINATMRTNGPVTFIFTLPINERQSDVVFSVRLSASLQNAANGFRTDHTPLVVAINATPDAKGDRLAVQRADRPFLASRTGSQLDLNGRKIAVVGCGAIGGYLALDLADSGASELVLVDPDTLRAENGLRHSLGLSGVGFGKVYALKKRLQKRLPELRVDVHAKKVEALLIENRQAITSCDLVILATGDHTLELRLSRALRNDCQLVHVWLEAFGVGGHLFVDGHKGGGCLACLFEWDPILGLFCRASLLEAGQDFTRSIGGCAGVFTPFGALDAQRAALEAARAVTRILTGGHKGALLTTWSEMDTAPETVKVSARGKQISSGARIEVTASQLALCERCR